MKRPSATDSDPLSASISVTAKIKELGDWRGKTLGGSAPNHTRSGPGDRRRVEVGQGHVAGYSSSSPTVASSARAETYKNVVKMTFAKGAALQDPSGLFNSSLDGNVRRAIDIHESDQIDEPSPERSNPRRSSAQSRKPSQKQSLSASPR